jgi:multidrug efflux pump subunit AcrB
MSDATVKRSIIRQFAEHRVAANLTMILMILAGLWAMKQIPAQLDPPVHVPLVFVEVEWRGAAAEDIEELVTTPIEQQLRTLTNLREVTSYTTNEYVQIAAEFEYDADMVIALDQVKQRVANLRNLPPGIEPPTVRRFVDLEPVITLLVTGPGEIDELIPLVRGMEKELLSRGIEAVEYDGLPQEEIAVLVPGQRLEELGLTLDDLAHDVARVSSNVPAGTIGRGQGSRQLRSLDQQRSSFGFEKIVIEHGDSLLRLGDIARIERRPRDGQPIVTRANDPAIEMHLLRATESDALRADRIVDQWLAETRPNLPDGVEIATYNDIWELLGAQLRMVLNNAWSGLLLVVITMFAFLNGRVAWWVTAGVPICFMLGLGMLYGIFGYGISIIALIAFIMAIGIVVDDSIIVGEDAMALFEQGKSPADAAVLGAERMFVPVLTATFTTLAAFLPLVLIGGPMGDVVLTLPVVMVCVLVASLVECFLVMPAHLKGSFETMRKVGVKPRSEAGRRLRDWLERGFVDFRDRRFMKLVRRALDYPGATLCAAVGGIVCAFSLVLSQHVGINFITGFDIEALSANVEFSAAATDTEKAAFMTELERTLVETNDESGGKNLLGWVTKRNVATFNDERRTGVQYASISGPYEYEENRTERPRTFADKWRKRVTLPPFVEQFELGVDGGANAGRPDLMLVLRGETLESVKAGAEELAAVLRSFDGVTNVGDDLPYGKDQLIFNLTSTGRALGITADSLGAQLRAAYNGERVQIFNQNDAELEVRVMLPDAERDDLASLQQFPIRTPDGEFVPLANVATLYNRRGIDVIRHNDSEMAVRVFATIDPEVTNAFRIISTVEQSYLPDILARHHLTFGLTGKTEDDRVIVETMMLGGVLTLLMIYLILACSFSSYVWPLAIMTAIPFGLTGAIVGHWVWGEDIGAMSLLAFFCLSGVVVNDSIVLVSFLRRELESGTPLRLALERCVTARFRAVFLTSATTSIGLLPMLVESGSLDFYTTPIAITIGFGLTCSTLLVLIVVPALILLFDGLQTRLRAWIAMGRSETVSSMERRPMTTTGTTS